MSERTIKTGVMYRIATLRAEDAPQGEDDRQVTLTFSSEEPVDRFFGSEVLDHGAKSVRLGRLTGGAPVLFNHDPDRHLGVVAKASVADGRGQATVRFGSNPLAAEKLQDVRDGILRGVSVGYRIHAMQLEESDDEDDRYRVTDWEPLEISMVTIPADASVGVGRSDEKYQTRIIDTRTPKMDPTETPTKPSPAPEPRIDVGAERERASTAERKRITELRAYEKNFPELSAVVEKAIADGTTVEHFARGALDEVFKTRPLDAGAAKIDMPAKDAKRWSLLRAIRAASSGDWGEAGLELEASRAVASKLGRAPRHELGFFIPSDVPGWSKRDLTTLTTVAGGHLRGTDHLGSDFIDALRETLVLRRMGARMMTGLQGNVAIPALNARTTVYWVAENSAPTEGAPTFRQVTMSPKTAAAYVDMSRRLIIQSDPSVEDVIRMDLVEQVASAVDAVGIEGGGTNQPTGILGTSGIGAVTIGTNGGAPTWSTVVNLEREVAIDNAAAGRLAYLTNPKVVAKLRQTGRQASGVEGNFIMNEGGNTLLGYPVESTTNVPSDLTKGSGSALSALIFGNFAELLIGQWGAVDVMVDPYSLSTIGATRITIFTDVDIAVRHAESFAAIKELVTT